MANPQLISNIAQIMGNRGMQPAAPASTDPRQQTMMQQLGITNPLLQQFGQQVGNLIGVDMRSPVQQLNASLGGVEGSSDEALEQQLTILANSPAASPEQRIQAAAKLKEIRQAKKATKTAMSQQDAFAKFIGGRHPELTDLASKGVVTPKNYKDFVAGGEGSKLGYLVSKDSGQTVGNVVIGKNGNVFKDGKPLSNKDIEDKGLIVSSSFEKQGTQPANNVNRFVNMFNESTGERMDVQYRSDGTPLDSAGNELTQQDMEGFAAIKLDAPRNVAADKASVSFNTSLRDSLQDSDMEYGDNRRTGQRLVELSKSAVTGKGAEAIADLTSVVSTGLRAFNLPVPDDMQTMLQEAGELSRFKVEALKPFIEAQGRGFTDPDRKMTEKAIAGIQQTPQMLELLGVTQQAQSYAQEEKIALSDYYATLEDRSAVNPKTAWANYQSKLPRLYTLKDDKGNEISTMPQLDVQDGRLYEYWQKGIPLGFEVQIGDDVAKLDWKALETVAKKKNTTARRLLSDFRANGLILDAYY